MQKQPDWIDPFQAGALVGQWAKSLRWVNHGLVTLRFNCIGCLVGVLLLGGEARAQSPTASAAPLTDPLRASGVKTNATLAESLLQSPDHTSLLRLVKASGLTQQAAGKTQYTVFAPTNAAFSVLAESDLRQMLLPSSKKRLIGFLAYHVVKGRLTSDQLKDGQTLTNLTGQRLLVHKQGDNITIKDGRGVVADVIQANIRTTNGVVYSINKVLQRASPKGPIVR